MKKVTFRKFKKMPYVVFLMLVMELFIEVMLHQ